LVRLLYEYIVPASQPSATSVTAAAAGLRHTPEELARAFARADDDHSGEIGLEEFITLVEELEVRAI
jgi:Ca2+-binding EF-hand superfamily protein